MESLLNANDARRMDLALDALEDTATSVPATSTGDPNVERARTALQEMAKLYQPETKVPRGWQEAVLVPLICGLIGWEIYRATDRVEPSIAVGALLFVLILRLVNLLERINRR